MAPTRGFHRFQLHRHTSARRLCSRSAFLRSVMSRPQGQQTLPATSSDAFEPSLIEV